MNVIAATLCLVVGAGNASRVTLSLQKREWAFAAFQFAISFVMMRMATLILMGKI